MLLRGVEYAHSKQKRAADVLLAKLLFPVRGMTKVVLLHEFKKHGVDLSALILEQDRVGQNGEQFVMQKFRTLQPPANRVPISGTTDWMRKKGVDESQQLNLIHRGTMSFVGRRALLPKEFAAVMHDATDPLQLARYKDTVLPTKTGLLSSWGILAHTHGYTGAEEADMRIEMEIKDVVDGSLHYDLRLGLHAVYTAGKNELRHGNTPSSTSY